jgi:hypothetical protein
LIKLDLSWIFNLTNPLSLSSGTTSDHLQLDFQKIKFRNSLIANHLGPNLIFRFFRRLNFLMPLTPDSPALLKRKHPGYTMTEPEMARPTSSSALRPWPNAVSRDQLSKNHLIARILYTFRSRKYSKENLKIGKPIIDSTRQSRCPRARTATKRHSNPGGP